MFAYDYECVLYDGDFYCVECLPAGVDDDSEEVDPIFASAELNSAPTCCVCGAEHDYMTILDEDDKPQGETDDVA